MGDHRTAVAGVDNFQPLSRHVESRHRQHQCRLIEGGDAYVETEMTFDLADDGSPSLAETAVQNPIFSSVGKDRSFAGTFAKNLRDQGFDSAAAKAFAKQDENLESEIESDSEIMLFLPGDSDKRIEGISDDLQGDRITAQEAFPQVRDALREVSDEEKQELVQQSRKGEDIGSIVQLMAESLEYGDKFPRSEPDSEPGLVEQEDGSATLITETSSGLRQLDLNQEEVDMFKAASLNTNSIERERGFDAAKAWMAEQSAVIVRSQIGEDAAENAPRSTINRFAGQLVDDYEQTKPQRQEQAEAPSAGAIAPEPNEPETDSFHVEDATQKDGAIKAAIDSGESFSFTIDSNFDPEQDDVYTSTRTQNDGSEQVQILDSDEIRVGSDGASVEVEVGYDASGNQLEDVFVRVPDFDAQLEAQSQQQQATQEATDEEPEQPESESIADGNAANQLQPEPEQPEPEGNAIADDDVDNQPSPEPKPEAPFDYADTLKSLRSSAEKLPAAQRDTLLKAVQQVEQMEQQQDVSAPEPEAIAPDSSQEPEESPEPVTAGELVTSAIAQNNPELDAQLTTQDVDSKPDGEPVPSVDEFRDWYRAARSLGKDNQLGRIQTLGELAKENRLTRISDKDAEQMGSDLAEVKEHREQRGFAETMADDARRFVSNLESFGLVERDEAGTGVVNGNIYTVHENSEKGEIGVVNRETGGTFAANQDGIIHASGLTKDDQKRWTTLGSSSRENLNAKIGKRIPKRQPQPQEAEL